LAPLEAARPYLAGSLPGKFNWYLGAVFDGSRRNKLYRQDVGHDEIVAALTPLTERYAKERGGERASATPRAARLRMRAA
jgi:sulfite reductase (NADPH) hemoprotein beta-component